MSDGRIACVELLFGTTEFGGIEIVSTFGTDGSGNLGSEVEVAGGGRERGEIERIEGNFELMKTEIIRKIAKYNQSSKVLSGFWIHR